LTVLAAYRERVRDLDNAIAAARLRGNNSGLMLAGSVGAVLIGLYYSLTQGLPLWLLVPPAVLAVIAGASSPARPRKPMRWLLPGWREFRSDFRMG